MSEHNDQHDHGHDDWFRHSPGEGLPQHEHAAHVNSTAIGLTLLAIVFGVLLTVIVLSMYFVSYSTRLKAERQEGTGSASEYLAYRDQSARLLDRFGWADRDAGTVNLPIERAMDDVVAFYDEPGRGSTAAWHVPAERMARDDRDAVVMEGQRADD